MVEQPDPGFYPDMPDSEYHSIPALSRSTLVRMARSPAHSRVPVYETPAMTIGTALHCAVLESGRYAKEYVMPPKGLKLTIKKGKAWKSEQGDKTILPRGGRGTTTVGGVDIEGMVKMIREDEDANRLLASGISETSAFWVDPETEVLSKLRADFLADNMTLIDIKTTTDSRYAAFSKKCADMRYHFHEWYLEGLTVLTGVEHTQFAFIVVETKEPYGVNVYFASKNMLRQAREEIRPLVRFYNECLKTNKWPVYEESIQIIDLPKWARLYNENLLG